MYHNKQKIKYLFIGLGLIATIACNNKRQTDAIGSEIALVQEKPGTRIHNTDFEFVSDTSKTLDLKYSFEQLDNTIGLSNSSVNAIFQDSENIMWVGTWDGLNRYDGVNFKIFRPELNNENSLSNQVILKIGEDAAGHIWILTMHGINRYNKSTDTFQHFYFARKNRPPLSESEFNMALDGSKTVFCAAKDWGIGYFDGADFRRLSFKNELPYAVNKMEFTATGELLVLFADDNLYSLKLSTDSTGKKSVSKFAMLSKGVRDFGIMKNRAIAVISKEGNVGIRSLLDNSSLKINTSDVQAVVGSYSGDLVLSGKSGLLLIDSAGTKTNQTWFSYLKNLKTTIVVRGNENILWAGTDGDGVFKMYPIKKSFNLISKEQIPELNGGIIRAFLEVGENSFWVGTKGKGLFRFPSKNNDYFKVPLKYRNFNESNSTINNAVFALHRGQDSLVFIGTDGDGIDVFDLKKSRLINWSEILESDQCEYFKSTYTIYQDKKGFVWLGTYGFGMIRLKIERSGANLKVTEFKKFSAAPDEKQTLSSNIIYSILPKSDHELWIGTRLGGLNIYNKKSGTFKIFKNEKDNIQSLSSNDVLCLFTDPKNRLWVGTSFGLNLLKEIKNDGSGVFQGFTVKDGLPNNTIHGIISDEHSNLWISTNFGLSNYIEEESKFINFTKNEGLQNNEFSDGAFYHSNTSDLVFMGGIKGFNYFLPSKIKGSTIVPDLFINKISGQNQKEPYLQSLVVSPYSKTRPSIVLKHNQNFIDVELAALTYINSEKCQYAYYLENFDQNWNTINTRRTISFTNVPAGSYGLWLKWSNSDGVWGDPVRAVDIKITPIFWRSNLAFTLYLFLFLLILLLLFSYYKKRQSLRQNIIFRKKDEEIHQNRLTFFTNIAHEFQTPLTLITGPIQKLSEVANMSEKNQKFIRMIERNSSRLLFLTQQLLEFRKAEYDYLEVSAKQFDLVNLVEHIAELFDDLAIQNNLNYILELPPKLEGYYDKDKIEKVVFNLLSNAFKYTPKNGKVKLKFLIKGKDTKTLIIKVSNSGKGIPKEKLDFIFDRFFLLDKGKDSDTDKFRTGIGLAYVKKLVNVLRGEITVSSRANRITSFTVLLPCSKEAFNNKELDSDAGRVFISPHLKNILEDVSTDDENIPSKISSLEVYLKKRKVVLIVEDKKDVQLFLSELLDDKYQIHVANNGVEAMAIIKTTAPDIIISDVMMPEMDGIALCKKIKGDINTCHIPFIMLTAKDSIIHRIKGLESGANSYIPKPFHPDHLLIRVKKLLEERELILKHFSQDDMAINISQIPVNEEEKDLVAKIIELIHKNIENENLNSAFLAEQLGMSDSQLFRKIKQALGFSPGDLIRTIRIKHAADLLRNNTLTVSEVCYRSGFNNRSYFYREFKKMYNITPKNYQLTSGSNSGNLFK